MHQIPNIRNTSKDYCFLFVQLAVFAVFAGRAWQHIFWDAPFRSLLWDEALMSGLVAGVLQMPWETYITSINVDDAIQNSIRAFGWFYAACAIIAIFIRKVPRWLGKVLLLGSFGLIFLAGLYCKEKFFSLGQFFEYALQFSAPIFLYLLAFQQINRERIIFAMKIAIVLSFTCHGLYAINYYPRPGNFVDMTLNILPVQEQQAYQFLYLAGILDFLISMAIFLKGKLRNAALLYAIFWGFATSIARVWANFYMDAPLESLHEWLFESVMRFPHFLIPLAVYIYYKEAKKPSFVQSDG